MHPKDQKPAIDERGLPNSDYWYRCPALLDSAAGHSSFETFELLRARGAPLGWRTLHFAAAACMFRPHVLGRPEGILNRAHCGKRFADRKALVRLLVDDLGCDVNAMDQPEGWRLGNYLGRPLAYVARSSYASRNCTWIVHFLLSRGADPALMKSTDGIDEGVQFWSAVEGYKATHASEAS